MAIKEFSFVELDNMLSKNVDDRGSISSSNAFSNIDEFIDTGNYLLNAQISGSLFGGYPNCRTIALAGETGTGKTFLALNGVRCAQAMGYHIVYCDSEAAVDAGTFKKFGCDPDKIRYQPVSTPLEFKKFVSNLLKYIDDAKKTGKAVPKIMLVLDSLGNLATTKERADAVSGSEKKDMTKAQEMRSLFRVITMDLAGAKIPFIMTAHTYASVGSFIPMDVMSGGGGPLYNASVILFLYKSGLKVANAEANKVGLTKTGIIVRSAPHKNRFARPITIRFHISFYKGMNPYVGLEQFIGWEQCGIAKGNIGDEKAFNKMTPAEQEAARKEGRVWEHNGKLMFCVLKETARNFVVKHLNDTVPAGELFTPRVLTQEVLKELDETTIKPTFQLPSIGDMFDMEGYAEDFALSTDENSETENALENTLKD
ncbi:MAG: hypothetical protein WC979_01240 [Candidatus Pacearchaeota archaeon]|jgi:RecA/RadA recombinase